MKATHDVIVIGAGPGGSAAAEALTRQGLEVLLLDQAAFPRDKTCGDALAPRAIRVLREQGVLPDLIAKGARSNRLVIVGPRGEEVHAPFPGREGHVLVVPRVILDDALRRQAIERGSDFIGQARVEDITQDQNGVTVTGERLGEPFEARARAAIIATGASTGLLKRAGFLKRQPVMGLAARAYVENAHGLDDLVQLRFDDIPLPGYGWIFPMRDGHANVGAGVFPRWGKRTSKITAKAVFDAFTQSPGVRERLEGARMVGPVKGYPLRVDFGRAPTVVGRVLAVGEAAGLVNPLTGEGIDYALESGRLAAAHLERVLKSNGNNPSPAHFAAYHGLLLEHFKHLFWKCNLVRDLCVRPFVLDQMVRWANRRNDLKLGLIDLVFGIPRGETHPSRSTPSLPSG